MVIILNKKYPSILRAMSIFNNGNFAKPFNVSQPQLNSSDRTANLRSKTKYASAVNLAKNGGVLTKQDGSKYVGPVHTTSATMTSADSYSDLLDVTKGKYLLTPPPSSNLDTSFSPASGDVFYGSFTVTDYAEAKIPVTMLGAPGVTTSPAPTKYDDPNKLVAPVPPASAPPPFNNTSIVVDPEYRMFYGKKTCGMRDYFKNVRIDPSADVRWTADGVVHSSRPYNQQQAQRILAHEAQRLRGFQYPARVHLDLDNCESKPSITPVAPDAPVIYISSQTLTSDEPELFTVTVAWPHGFDGGSPITSYTVYTSTDESHTVDPQPCLNSWTLYHVALTTQIWVTATNCIPQSSWPSGTPAPHCTPMTSDKSNPVNPAPPHLPTITIAFSSGPNPMPYEPNKVITMTITSDNPMPFSVTSSQLDNGLAQLNPPNGGSGTRALSTTNSYSITLVSGKNPTVPRTTISVSFMQASGGGYSRGFATATLVILPALPPKIVFKLNGSSATTLTVQYALSATIPMTISSNYPVAQSAYQVSITYSGTDSGYAQITSGNAGIQLLKNPPWYNSSVIMTITVTQPGTANYPQGTATKTLTITSAPPPTVTIGLPATVQYVPNATIPMTIGTTSNPPLTSQSAYQVSSSNTNLVEITSGNAGIQLLPNANSTSNQQVTITVIQPATANYPSGTATKALTITPAPPPTVTVALNPASSVTYAPDKNIALSITSTSNPQPQLSAYTVKSSNTNLARIIAISTSGDTIMGYAVELIANPSAPSQPVTITVIQPGTSNYPSGTGTATLTIIPVPIITLTLTSTVTYEPGKHIALTITSTNPPPNPFIASSGETYFLLTSGNPSTGTLSVLSNDYNKYVVGQVLTATAVPGSGTFGGATVTVTDTSVRIQGIAYAVFIISVSIVGGSPASGNVSNVTASTLYTISLSPPSISSMVQQIIPPSSGSSNYTLVLASTAHPTQDMQGTITVIQAASGGFAQGTATKPLTIQPIQMTQKNFTGWLPSGLTSQQPDFMTQEIVTTGTPFYVMGFNTGGNYTLSRYNQGATLTTLLTGSGSITSINEQLITNPSMSGGRNLIVCGNFQSATIPTTSTTTSTTTRVNNIFQYNVDTQAVIPLQCATTSPTTPPTYPVGTNGQVWGCEVDTANNRVWVWGDFTGCGTLASGGDTGVAALDVKLATGADFVTSANWTNPVSWQGCAAYLGVHAAKLGGASTGYALFCYKLQDYNGAFASPTSNPKTGVVRPAGTNWYSGTYLNGSNISGTVLSIYQFGPWFIFAGGYTQATYDGTNATTAYSMSIMDATKTISAGGVYGAALQPTMKNTDATFWKNGGYPTIPGRIALLSNNYLCITTSGYPVGGIMTYDFNNNNIESNTVAPTKWGGFTAPYSANYIGGTDPTNVKLIASMNANPFYYSQTFNMKPITLQISGFTSQDYTIMYLDANGVHDPTRTTPYLNGYTVHKFNPTSTKSATITSNIPITNLSYLVIGGGGGGGNPSNTGGNPNDQPGGGGGAGGFVTNYPSGPTIALQSSTGYSLTVGGGGAANTAGTASSLAYDNVTITALGGGYGGSVNQSGGNGGSGGGGGGAPSSGPPPGGSGMQGQGNGGTSGGGVLVGWMGSSFAQYGGGGGGAGGGGSNGITMAGSMVGGSGSWGGNGGSGLQSNIDGTVSTYAGGGGGGGPGGYYPSYSGIPSGLQYGMGGSGIGGNGGNAGGGSGTNGTGSGGGGGFTAGGQNFGGTGGSGIVILRFSSYSYNQ